MSNQSANFQQARLKHEWANHHISLLQSAWQQFLETDFCTLALESDAKGTGQVIRIKSISPVPTEFELYIGDAVHNLRCALDYTVSEILGWKDTRLTFPMGETREELVNSFRTEPEVVDGKTKGKGRNAAIEVAINGIGAFIVDEIKPYKASGGLLWPLGKLDGRDKHRLLIPTLVPQTIGGINAIDANDNQVIGGSATVGPGGVSNFVGFGAGGVKILSYGKPTAEIFLNETGIIEGRPILPTLIQMSRAVTETIDRIEEFATSSGWRRTAN